MDKSSISEKLLQVRAQAAEGYRPVIDYNTWRVAVLNYSVDLRPENLVSMQRHNETDEVFILLRGRCILFLGQGDDTVSQIFAEDMQPLTIYNVRKGAWHTHALSRDGMVLIVENRDTTYDNSPFCPLSTSQRASVVQLTRSLWGGRD